MYEIQYIYTQNLHIYTQNLFAILNEVVFINLTVGVKDIMKDQDLIGKVNCSI